jgi:hypothetical protein
VIAITTFAGGTSFLGALIARKRNFSEQQILFFTAFGAGILMAAAIFGMVIDKPRYHLYNFSIFGGCHHFHIG